MWKYNPAGSHTERNTIASESPPQNYLQMGPRIKSVPALTTHSKAVVEKVRPESSQNAAPLKKAESQRLKYFIMIP